MNIVNRLIVVLALVVIILFALMAIVLSWAFDAETIHKLAAFASYLGAHDNTRTKAFITLLSAVAALIGLAFLLLELVPRGERTVVVRDTGAGLAVLSTTAIARRVEQIVAGVPQVEAVRAKVKGKKTAVEVGLQVMVDPESDLSALANEICRTTDQAVTQQINVAMAKPPSLRLYYSHRLPVIRPPAARPSITGREPKPSPETPPSPHVKETHERTHVRRTRTVPEGEESPPIASVEGESEAQRDEPSAEGEGGGAPEDQR